MTLHLRKRNNEQILLHDSKGTWSTPEPLMRYYTAWTRIADAEEGLKSSATPLPAFFLRKMHSVSFFFLLQHQTVIGKAHMEEE